METYQDNMYHFLKRQGYDEKYEHAGIYFIQLGKTIVYIGKSTNMLKRVAQHYVGIRLRTKKKYCIMSDIQRQGHPITFGVLYYAKNTNYLAIDWEIGEKESEYIRELRPCLNTQIPKKENWQTFDVREIDEQAIYEQFLS